jgi:hypothetical protein
VPLRTALALLALTLLAGCTSNGPATTSAAARGTTTRTRTVAPSDGPVVSGPTVAATASGCPFAAQDFVRDTIGMRLGRITVLRSAGRTVGCRFYALQDSALHVSEHLPGPRQPAVEITTQRYTSAAAAHNGFVLVARRGTNPQQVDLGGGRVGVCFQTDFYAQDHGTDWACAGSTGVTAVVVRTVVTSPALNAQLVTERVLRDL